MHVILIHFGWVLDNVLSKSSTNFALDKSILCQPCISGISSEWYFMEELTLVGLLHIP